MISYLTYCVRSNHEMVIMDPYNRFILWCFFRHSPKSIQRYGSKLLIDSPFLINCLITYSSSYFLLIISIEHMSPFSIDLTCRLANTLRWTLLYLAWNEIKARNWHCSNHCNRGCNHSCLSLRKEFVLTYLVMILHLELDTIFIIFE